MSDLRTEPNTILGLPSVARKYRSKRERPCDLCRSRKTVCKIPAERGVCDLCKRLQRRCTFLIQPLRKEKPRPIQHPLEDQREPGISQEEPVLRETGYLDNGHVDIIFDDNPFLLPSVTSQVSPFSPQTTSQLDGIDWSFLESHNAPREKDGLVGRHPSAAATESQLPQDYTSPGDQELRSKPHRLDRRPPAVSDRESDVHDYISNAGSRETLLTRADGDWTDDFSLDAKPGYSNQYIGLSNETDPFLLSHFHYDNLDNYTMFRLTYRKITDDVNLASHIRSRTPEGVAKIPTSEAPIQFQIFNETICEENIRVAEKDFSVHNSETEDVALLKKIVPDDSGHRLLNLFFRFVQPSYPFLSARDYDRLSTGEAHNVPVGLRAAVYALATPFYFMDDQLCVRKSYLPPDTDDLWGIAHRSLQRSFQRPHLSMVQLCLLLLQRPPVNPAVGDLPDSWALSCSALAAAESVGLHLDPSSWRLPRWEIRLRRRLWWMVYVDHTWRALVLGRPSHLKSDCWIVSRLTFEDLEAGHFDNVEIGNSIRNRGAYFLALCDLTLLANDILSALYTAKAIFEANTFHEILARVQPLKNRLKEWEDCVFTNQTADEDADGFHPCVYLRLSHMTLELLLFRALLRAVAFPSAPSVDPTQAYSAIFQESQSCAKLGVELVSRLASKDFVHFWPPYARYHIAYISTFILLLFVKSSSIEMATENKQLLEKWRVTLHTQVRAWPVFKLAAIRLDAIFWAGLEKVSGLGMDSSS